MTARIQTIGVANGGGDCSGLNAVIRGVVRSAILQYGRRVVGITDGFDGLIWPERAVPLTLDSVAGILPHGSTNLGTTNRGNPFRYPVQEGEGAIEREATGKKSSMVVVAEGVKLPALDPNRRPFPKPRPGRVGNLIGDAIHTVVKKEVRIIVLGHVQRGGSPSPFDRILATRFGVAAVELVAAENLGRMVCLRANRIESVPLKDAVGTTKRVDPHGEVVRTARALGITFGDLT